MFESIKRNWALARAENLRAEFSDMMQFYNSRHDLISDVEEGAKSYYRHLTTNLGPLLDLPNKQKKTLAKGTQKTSRELFQSDDIGTAIGMSFIAIWLESSALPGEDAERVLEPAGDILIVLGVLEGTSMFEVMGDEPEVVEDTSNNGR